MKNLYIDFDGVILDTITTLYKDLTKDLGSNTTEKQKREYFSNYPWKNILKDENIINDGINAILKIIDSKKFNVNILTHINSLNEGVLKIKYLRKYFKDITIILCPKEISKTKMIKTEDSILIDDYSGNLKEWEKEKGIPIKFSLTNEKKEFPVVSDLAQIIDMF